VRRARLGPGPLVGGRFPDILISAPIRVELSVTVPIYHEEANITELHRCLQSVLAGMTLPGSYELLFVNEVSASVSYVSLLNQIRHSAPFNRHRLNPFRGYLRPLSSNVFVVEHLY
jgi:hypothetical protein